MQPKDSRPEMSKASPDVSVIVPCYRDPDLLGTLLRSLQAEESRSETCFEIIVVDSGLDDRVASVAQRHGARCVRGSGRLLAGDARNVGADAASGRVVAFVDADCVVAAGWIDALADGLRRGSRLVGGPVVNRLPWYTIASVDNLLQFADFGPGRPGGPLPHVPSCNMAMGRDDFLALGGFEHQGQPSGEDVLLTTAATRRWPGSLVFVPAMRVAHLGRRSMGEMLRHHHDFGYVRGALRLHLSERQIRWGRLAVLMPAVMLKRISYVATRGLRYGGTTAGRLLVTLPLLISGVLAWTLGFRRGLREER